MLIELTTAGGDVVQAATDLARPAPGDVFLIDGKEWAVSAGAPRSRQEMIPMGAGPRLFWVTRFIVEPATALAGIPPRPVQAPAA